MNIPIPWSWYFAWYISLCFSLLTFWYIDGYFEIFILCQTYVTSWYHLWICYDKKIYIVVLRIRTILTFHSIYHKFGNILDILSSSVYTYFFLVGCEIFGNQTEKDYSDYCISLSFSFLFLVLFMDSCPCLMRFSPLRCHFSYSLLFFPSFKFYSSIFSPSNKKNRSFPNAIRNGRIYVGHTFYYFYSSCLKCRLFISKNFFPI